MVDRPLHFPSDTYFSCTDCGKCCSTSWRIKVDAPRAETVRETDIYQRLSREGYHPLKVMDDEFEIARGEDGRCYFLEDGLCGIHREKGARAKPSVCQLYPFSLVSTPDGYFVSLAFTCPAVISGLGEPVVAHTESLQQTVRDSPHFFPPDLVPGRQVTLTSLHSTEWSEYLQLESEILRSVRQTEDLVDTLLRSAAAVLIGSWEEESLASDASHQLKESLKEMLPIFAANSIASLEKKGNPEQRVEFAQSLLYGQSPHSTSLGAPAPQYRTENLGCQLTRSVLRRYVKNKVWGKVLLTGPTLTIRLLMLALSVEILLYYYEARKSLDGVLHFDPELLEWSIDLIETDFLVHHELVIPLMTEWERIGLELAAALG